MTELHCDMLITNLLFIYYYFFRTDSLLVNKYVNNFYLFEKLNIFLSFKEVQIWLTNYGIAKRTSRTCT